MLKSRTINILAFFFCTLLLGYGFYLQFAEGLEPCPLCMLQRIVFGVLLIFFLLAALHNPPAKTGRRIYAVITLLFGGFGAALAMRQLWLQSHPDAHVACAPGFNYMLQHLPLTETLKFMITGTGDCKDIVWTFWGLTIPGWSLVFFVLLAIVSIYQCFRRG